MPAQRLVLLALMCRFQGFGVLLLTLTTRVERYKSLWALHTSPPQNRFTTAAGPRRVRSGGARRPLAGTAACTPGVPFGGLALMCRFQGFKVINLGGFTVQKIEGLQFEVFVGLELELFEGFKFEILKAATCTLDSWFVVQPTV